ncbi:cupin domain-containing protein [Luteibacter aegosomatis]|uniref:cupin domain-containing protein n=1 Tax=Luteibacter aegosomatis TaxID=2911537 RepID=UPI001FF83695|nr:cupin domain-containing protein [Luteibacter aegosomatis]UPG87483.1 cupin domain-containing protein [Luteibacter aegosomatis]
MNKLVPSLCLCLLSLAGIDLAHAAEGAPDAKVGELVTKALADYPGKDITLITVDYPPGAVDPVHRHDAHAVVYVLEGSIVMGVKGQPERTLNPGDTFYEGPNDIHTVGHNASKTKPAKFLVFMLKDAKKPILTPVN